jgi:3-oxoacyl-[acyl-carrier-protein] synthase II
MTAALADARLRPDQIDYINAHGTGTPLNDVIEAQAITRVFGDTAPPVSSSKGQIGHAIAAAGALELLACIATLRDGRLPPNPRLHQPDPRITLDLVEAQGRTIGPEVVMSNSFGFGGQNAALVVARAGWKP